MSNESKTLFEQELLQAENRAKTHLMQVKNELELDEDWDMYSSGDSVEIKTDSDGESLTINPYNTYAPSPGADPIKKTPNNPLDPPEPKPGDYDPPGDAEDWAEYIKKVKEEEEIGDFDLDVDLDQPDPEELEAHRERVEKLVEALMKFLLEQDRSSVHMGSFMEDFDVVQKAMLKVRSGELLSDIEMHALNKIYNEYARSE